MNEPAVKVKGLTKAFQGREVIHNCSMTVGKGTIYGFLGKNGAGKTTVFKIITGLLSPTSGEVKILGMNVTRHNTDILSRIGSLIETPIFYDHLSATENLEIHLSYMNKSNSNIDNTLSLVGLNGTGNQPVGEFSLGMRQRLAIARAVVHEPELLILDEPVNGLDPMGIREMRELFIDLTQNKGMTILLSSHILSEIEQTADMVGVIVDGVVVKEVSLADVKQSSPNGLENYFIEIVNGGHANA